MTDYLKTFRPKTWASYQYIYPPFVDYFKRFERITERNILNYITKRLETRTKKGTFVSPSTINRELAYCRAAFNHSRKKLGYPNPF